MSKKKIFDKIKKMSNSEILNTLMEYSIWVAAPPTPPARGADGRAMFPMLFVALIALAAAAVAVAVPPFEPGYEEEMERIERAKNQREIDWSPVNHAQMERLIAAVERIATAMEKDRQAGVEVGE